PSKELINIEKEFNRLFNSFGSRFFRNSNGDEYENAVWMPLTDIIENKDNYVISLDIPGVKKEDVKISYSAGELSISGERKQEHESRDNNFYRLERSYGRFYRSFNLPKEIKEEAIEAEYKNGQLTVTIPKSESVKAKEIAIKAS